MAIKKEVVLGAIQWWLFNVYSVSFTNFNDYRTARDEWLVDQGICGIIEGTKRVKGIPYNIREIDSDFWCATEEEEILFLMKW